MSDPLTGRSALEVLKQIKSSPATGGGGRRVKVTSRGEREEVRARLYKSVDDFKEKRRQSPNIHTGSTNPAHEQKEKVNVNAHACLGSNSEYFTQE